MFFFFFLKIVVIDGKVKGRKRGMEMYILLAVNARKKLSNLFLV